MTPVKLFLWAIFGISIASSQLLLSNSNVAQTFLSGTLFLALVAVLIDGTVVDTLYLAFAKSKPKFQIMECKKSRVHFLFEKGNINRTFVIIGDPPNTIEHYINAGIIQELKTLGNVLCFDCPGFGFSFPKMGFKFSWEESAEIIEELLVKLNQGPYIFSVGCVPGLASLIIANKRPDLVSHMILMQCSTFEEEKKWAWRVDMKGGLSTKIVGQIFMQKMKKKISHLWYYLATGSKNRAKELVDITWETQSRGACFCLASSLQKLFYTVNKFPEIKLHQPTLVMWGNLDKTHRRTEKRAILKYLDESRTDYEEYDTVAHFPDLEQPEVFINRVKTFLEKYKKPVPL